MRPTEQPSQSCTFSEDTNRAPSPSPVLGPERNGSWSNIQEFIPYHERLIPKRSFWKQYFRMEAGPGM